MGLEETIVTLVNLAAGDLTKGGIYPVKFPQGVGYPAVSYLLIDAQRDDNLDGPNRLVDSRVQFDVLANNPDTAGAVRDRLRQTLNGFKGFVQGFEIIYSKFDDERDIPYDEATKSQGKQLDFIISHRD